MKIQSVKGFRDVLPDESARWAAIETRARAVFAAYDLHEIRIPIVERTDLFARSIGEATDIVEKEMYTFTDRDDTSLTLRPEGTAPVVRAYVEHGLQQQSPVWRFFYFGPMFRRERPQKGRLRQFSQIGVEVLGRDDAAADAEVLLLLYDLLDALEVRGAQVNVNSLGCRACRPAYREKLAAWGGENRERLCEDCRRRVEQNSLRLLDCKQPGCVDLRPFAPLMRDYLCDACTTHFARVLALLSAQGIEPRLDPWMVRGLDYYCRTAFEVLSSGLGAQNALGGGGRYDGLVRALGGGDVAGIGFALGMERLAMVLESVDFGIEAAPEFAVLPIGASAEPTALDLARRLRRGGARVALGSGEKSLKSQMRLADKLAARFALIIGEDELQSGTITIRDMAAKKDHIRAVPAGLSLQTLRAQLARLSGEG